MTTGNVTTALILEKTEESDVYQRIGLAHDMAREFERGWFCDVGKQSLTVI
jgi:hypothetical protein